MSGISRSFRRTARDTAEVPPLPHPSWNIEPAPSGPPRSFSVAEFWRQVGF